MLQNTRATAFTISELLGENQKGVGQNYHPPLILRLRKNEKLRSQKTILDGYAIYQLGLS